MSSSERNFILQSLAFTLRCGDMQRLRSRTPSVASAGRLSGNVECYLVLITILLAGLNLELQTASLTDHLIGFDLAAIVAVQQASRRGKLLDLPGGAVQQIVEQHALMTFCIIDVQSELDHLVTSLAGSVLCRFDYEIIFASRERLKRARLTPLFGSGCESHCAILSLTLAIIAVTCSACMSSSCSALPFL